MSRQEHVWFGMKLTPEQKKKIKRLAAREGTSAKEAVLRLVDDALSSELSEAPEGSFLDGIEELVGSVDGPADLSSNEKYFDGFGK